MAEYIEREALLAHIKDLPTWWADAGGVYGSSMKYPDGMFDCEDVVSSVENAPAADVAPVIHGHWIGEGDGYANGELVYDVWHCSECDYCIDDGTDDQELLPKYCPNCGAKMDGDEKDG